MSSAAIPHAESTDGDAERTVMDGPSTGASSGDDDTSVGAVLGRYAVLETVGSGGMGRVLRAYDPKLQREVALKIVRADVADTDARDRLLREARAMAQLSHPNVVAVYDAEESQGGMGVGVVLVMELVVGQTLREWIRSAVRTWPEIVACFCDAGRGLAAAHRVGMLHRDFKPANVLVADSGQVKVTDFGLAKLASATGGRHWDLAVDLDAGDDLDPNSGESMSGDSLSGTLTRADTVVGTLRYMAPEQHRREPQTAAVDQYAFCVALWEALVGKPPFSSKSHAALLAKKMLGAPAWPTEISVPRPIVDAVRRGLAHEPGARWPSMAELLAALEHDPAKRRQRWLMVLGGVGVVGVLGGGVQAWLASQADRCSGAREQLAGAWDDARREQARAGMLGAAAYADGVWERAAAELDRYSDAWVAMHTEACEATTVRGEQSTAVMDLRMACLRRAKLELSATVDVLADADADVVRRAHQLVAGLRPLSRCDDMAALQAEVEPPLPAEADAVEEVRAQLAEAGAETKAGRYSRAQQQVDAAKERAAAVEYGPVHTEIALVEGMVLERTGHYDASEAALQEGLRLAGRWRQWGALTDATLQLMYVVGARQQRPEDGLRYRAQAEGLVEGDPEQEAFFRHDLAIILKTQGKLDEAVAEYRRSLELRERVLGPDHPLVAQTRNNLGIVLNAQGKYAEAEAEHREVLALRERVLGPDHPDVGSSRANLGSALYPQGKKEEAEAEFRLASEQWERVLGPDHPDSISVRGNLALMLNAQGKLAEAEAEYRRTIANQERVLGADHPEVAVFRNNLAVTLRAQGKNEEAEAEYRRTLALWEKARGPDHPDVATACSNLGNLLLTMGEHEEAEAQQRRALALWEAGLPPEHPHLAMARTNLAKVLIERDRFEEAAAVAELAWIRRQQDDASDGDRAETAMVLARALWGISTDKEGRARARGLAAQALEFHEGAGPSYAENADEVRTWLDQHQG